MGDVDVMSRLRGEDAVTRVVELLLLLLLLSSMIRCTGVVVDGLLMLMSSSRL